MSRMIDLENLILNIDEQLAEVTDKAAIVAQQAAAEREEMHRYILVEIGTLHMAIAIEDLSEVGPLPTLTLLPNLPSWIQGIVNIRSEIVSVIDFCRFLNVPGRVRCDGNRFAVLRNQKQKIGVRVDRIIGNVNKAASDTKSIEMLDKNPVDTSLFSSGLLVEKNIYYILNVPRFLKAPRLLNYNGKA